MDDNLKVDAQWCPSTEAERIVLAKSRVAQELLFNMKDQNVSMASVRRSNCFLNLMFRDLGSQTRSNREYQLHGRELWIEVKIYLHV